MINILNTRKSDSIYNEHNLYTHYLDRYSRVTIWSVQCKPIPCLSKQSVGADPENARGPLTLVDHGTEARQPGNGKTPRFVLHTCVAR